MKFSIYSILSLFLFLGLSCSNDDDSGSNEQDPPTAEELLVDNSPWTFTSYNLINIINAGPSDATESEIESGISNNFMGLTLIFNANGTGTAFAPAPQQLDSNLTWTLSANNTLQLVVADFEEEDNPVIFGNIQVSETDLSVDFETSYYDEEVDFEVDVYGTLSFQ